MSALSVALEQTEVPPELYMPFRGLRSTPMFFSDYCRKLTTHKGVTITRFIVCTSEHFYLCHPNGDILRCFPYTAISKIFHDEQRHQLGIVVPCEFDLAVETPLSFQLLHVIDVLRRMHGSRTPLEQVRVRPVPRPEGLLGFRPDGRPIWDETLKAARKKKRSNQTCTEKCMDACGMEDAWIGVKDGTYRYYRRAMRYLDLGIEDDEEVLTSTAAAMSTSAGAKPGDAPGGVVLNPGASTMLLAAGKTTAELNKNNASGRRMRAMSMASQSKDGSIGGSFATQSDGEEAAEGETEGAPSGYRWFREIKGSSVRKAQDEEAAALATDNEVLNMLLSPMLAQDDNSWHGTGAAAAAAAFDGNNINSSSAEKAKQDAARNEWWPGCQIGSADGPYALSLAKPQGFRVALDQRNSEFA